MLNSNGGVEISSPGGSSFHHAIMWPVSTQLSGHDLQMLGGMPGVGRPPPSQLPFNLMPTHFAPAYDRQSGSAASASQSRVRQQLHLDLRALPNISSLMSGSPSPSPQAYPHGSGDLPFQIPAGKKWISQQQLGVFKSKDMSHQVDCMSKERLKSESMDSQSFSSALDSSVDDNEELTILPRRRAGQPEDMKRNPIVLTRKDLKDLYGMRLSEAAARLDISVTAMKAVCRKAGITKWPYRRIQFYKSRGIQFTTDELLKNQKPGKPLKGGARKAAASLRGRGSDVYEAKTGMDVAMHSSSGEEGDNLDEEEDDEFEDDSVNAIQATCQAPASGGNGDQDFSRLSSRGSIDAILN